MLYTGSLSMESVDSAWREKETKCNYRHPIMPALALLVCRERHFPLSVLHRRLSNRWRLVTVSRMIATSGSPSSRLQRLCRGPPWSRAAGPPGSTWRRDGRWADRSQSQPAQRGDQGFKKALFSCHIASSSATMEQTRSFIKFALCL